MNAKRILTVAQSYMTRKYLVYAGIAVVIIGGYAWYAAQSGKSEAKTYTVERGVFEQTVAASGKVVPARDVDLGFTQSGRVVSVTASVGSRVGAGQVLATIDSADIRANLEQRQAALESELAKLDALKQGTRPEEIAVAEADVAKNRESLSRAREALLDTLSDVYITADDAVRSDIHQFVSNPRTSNPQVNFVSTDEQTMVNLTSGILAMESTLAAWEASLRSLSAAGDLSSAANRAQRDLAAVSSLLQTAYAALSRAVPTSAVTQTMIDGYAADVAAARVSVSTAISSVTTAVTTVRNAETALASSERSLALKKAGTLQADIDAQAARVRAAEADIANVRAQLGKTVITAPFSGVITSVDAKVGLIVSGNTPVVSMISAGTYQIESYVPEVNIALLKPGNPATITLDAYGEEAVFDATVVSIDPAETVRDGVATYRVVLQFARADERIRSGMTANITITASARENIVSIPQGLVVERGDKHYVRVQTGETTIEREVAVGSVSSRGQIEILSGLSEGDVVVVGEAE